MNFADTITSWDDVTTDWISETPIDATKAFIGLSKAFFERGLDLNTGQGNSDMAALKQVCNGVFNTRNQGAHQTGRYYNFGDIVQSNSSNYICNVSHTAETFRTSRTSMKFKIVSFTKDTVFEDTFENIKVDTFTKTITADLINSGSTGVDVTSFWLVASGDPFSFDEDMVDTFIYAERPYDNSAVYPHIQTIRTPLYYEDNHTVSGNFENFIDIEITIYGEAEWHKTEAPGITYSDSFFLTLEEFIRDNLFNFENTEGEIVTNRDRLNEVPRLERVNALYQHLSHMKYHKTPKIADPKPDSSWVTMNEEEIRGDGSYSFTFTPTSSFLFSIGEGQLYYQVDGASGTLRFLTYGESTLLGDFAPSTSMQISVSRTNFYATVTVTGFSPVTFFCPDKFYAVEDGDSLGGGTITRDSLTNSVWNVPTVTKEINIEQFYSWEEDEWRSFWHLNPNGLPDSPDPDTVLTSPIFPRDGVVNIRKVVVTAAHGQDKVVTQNILDPVAVSAGTSLSYIIPDFTEKDVWDAGNWYRYEYYEVENYTYTHEFADQATAVAPFRRHWTQDEISIGTSIGQLPNYITGSKWFQAERDQYLKVDHSTGDLTVMGLGMNQGLDFKYHQRGRFDIKFSTFNTKTDKEYERDEYFHIHPGPISSEDINFTYTQTRDYNSGRYEAIGHWECLLYTGQIAKVELNPLSEEGHFLSRPDGRLHEDYYFIDGNNETRSRASMTLTYRAGSSGNPECGPRVYKVGFNPVCGSFSQSALITDVYGGKHFVGPISTDTIGLLTSYNEADFAANVSEVAEVDFSWDGPTPEREHEQYWFAGPSATCLVVPNQEITNNPGSEVKRLSSHDFLYNYYRKAIQTGGFSFPPYFVYISEFITSQNRSSVIDSVDDNVFISRKQEWTAVKSRYSTGNGWSTFSSTVANPNAAQGGSQGRLGLDPLFPSTITYPFDPNHSSLFEKNFGNVTIATSALMSPPSGIVLDKYEVPVSGGSITYNPLSTGKDPAGGTQLLGEIIWTGHRGLTTFRMTNYMGSSARYLAFNYGYGDRNSSPDRADGIPGNLPSPNSGASFASGNAGKYITIAGRVTMLCVVYNMNTTDPNSYAHFTTATVVISNHGTLPGRSFDGNSSPNVKISARLIEARDPTNPPTSLNLFGETLSLPFESKIVQDQRSNSTIVLGSSPNRLYIDSTEYGTSQIVEIEQIAYPSSEPQNLYIKNQKFNTKDGYMQFWDAYEREIRWKAQTGTGFTYELVQDDVDGSYATWQEGFDDLTGQGFTVDPNEPTALMVWDKNDLYEVTWRVQNEEL